MRNSTPIPGVVDGAFFLREDTTGSDRRGAPGRGRRRAGTERRRLTEQLRQLIDPVFLPRPLLIVEQLPRNATGKLPQQALQGFADEAIADQRIAMKMQSTLTDCRRPPVFRGSFPRHSRYLPGALLLDEMLKAIELARGIDVKSWRISSAKFLDAVRPRDSLVLEHEAPRARIDSLHDPRRQPQSGQRHAA